MSDPVASAGTTDRLSLVDARLVPVAVAAWAVSAWVVGVRPAVSLGVGVGAAVVAGGLLLLGERLRVGPLGALVAIGIATICLGNALSGCLVAGGVLESLAKRHVSVEVQGVIVGDPERITSAQGGSRYAVRLHAHAVKRPWEKDFRRAYGDVRVFLSSTDLPPGATVRLTGTIRLAKPGEREVASVDADRPPAVVAGPGAVQRVASRLRTGLRDSCRGLSGDAAALVPAIVVGDTSAVATDLRDAMRDSGLAHLTAVSGANTTLVCGAVLLGLRMCRLGRRWQVLGAALALAGFVVVARPQPSVVRAAVMGAVALFGLLAGRRGHSLSALCVCIVVLCAVDPYLARDLGFVLSVAATAAIVLISPVFARWGSRVLPYSLAVAIAVPVAAQLVCGPILILVRPQVPLLSVPANLAAAPAVAPVTVLGAVATLLAPAWAGGAHLVAWLAGLGAQWISLVARTSARAPGAVIGWPAGWVGALALLAVSVATVGIVALALRGRSGQRVAGSARAWLLGWRWGPPVAAGLVLVLVTGAVVVGLRRVASRAAWPPPGWLVVACDVGQGDALVIRTGASSAIVSDAGPEPSPIDGCLRRLGVDHVDLLILSHFHADHVGGVDGVLHGRRVDRAFVTPLAEPGVNAAAVSRSLAGAGVVAEQASTGASGEVGEVSWHVVWPRSGVGTSSRGAKDGESSAANDASVTVVFTVGGLRLLTTGDLEPDAQQGALAALRVAGVGTVDVVKVAHHGSRFQNPDLYQALAPRLALVSVGVGNDYGHPALATLDLLARIGAMVRRTDRDGDIAVGRGTDLWVTTRGRSGW